MSTSGGSNSKEEWRQNTLDPAVRRFPQREETFQTDSGLPIDTVYAPEDAPQTEADYLAGQGFPGEFPYTRGVQSNMYRGRLWTMRQYSGYATATDTNQRFRYLLEQGQTGLSVAFDLPTQIGYDSDHPYAEGEVGKVGVPVCTLEDMELLLKDIPLDRVSTSMTINATASVLLCLYIAAARRQGVSEDRLSGTLQNDILKEYIARGTYAYPPRPSMRLVVDVFKYCARPGASLEHHQHKRLPHAGSRRHRRSGACLYLRQRHCLRAGRRRCGAERGRLCAPPVLLLRGPEQPV